ncbi:ras and EF-hand domain-containing protein homolog isoform X2 [Dysidea avara]|uniref:ras and EF-hand domain-containing protein homolog isoform X2 n=1 Tax=Dysidea avara TaxID=196820 RepID=UPI00331CDC01
MMAGVQTNHWEYEEESFYRDKLQQVFNNIDRDHDGTITREELHQYCEGDQFEDAITTLDLEKSGSISFEQFYACFKAVIPMLKVQQPAISTPLHNMGPSYVAETEDDESKMVVEWVSIMRKFSIDSDSPLFQSKELQELIGQLEHQSPHLLDTMEQVISYLHADWQQLKKDCDNLQHKLKRESHHTAKQAQECDEVLKEQLEKEREAFVAKERQMKSKLNKQLREKEDYILQVLAQKRKLEEQLNEKEKEHVSLQQLNKELESEIKYKEDIISSSHSTPTLKQQHTVTTPIISVNSLEKKKEELLMSWMSRSNYSYSEAESEESCDEGPVSPTHLHPTSFLSPLHESELNKSAVSLAEEIEQLDDEKQGDSPPVVPHIQPQSNDETSLDQSPVHSSHQDEGQLAVTVGELSTSWSPQVNQSPLQSPSGSNSRGPSPTPYLESSDSSRESPIPTSHDHQKKVYRSYPHKQKQSRSHDQGGYVSHDQRSHYKVKRSQSIQITSSKPLYSTTRNFSCPDMFGLQAYGHQPHYHGKSGGSISAVWDDHHHDNCASVDSIHIRSLSDQQHTPLRRRSSITGTTMLPVVTEESRPQSYSPPSHVYKVVYLGNSGVGKSSVIRWFSSGSFQPGTESTIGMDYITHTVTVDNKQVLLQLWDTAGQERFGPITAVYCRRADAFILVYDITNRDSFVGIRGWTDVIKATLRDGSSVLLLIGNKRDVPHGDRQVSTREGEKLAEQLGALFMETSARSGDNVMRSHEQLTRKLLEREEEIISETKLLHSLYLNPVETLNKRKCFC